MMMTKFHQSGSGNAIPASWLGLSQQLCHRCRQRLIPREFTMHGRPDLCIPCVETVRSDRSAPFAGWHPAALNAICDEYHRAAQNQTSGETGDE